MKRKVDFYQKYIGKLKQLVNEENKAGDNESVVEDMYNQIKEEASEMEQSPEHHRDDSNAASHHIEPYQQSN